VTGALAAHVDRLRRSAAAAITGMVMPFVKGAAADLCVLAGVGTISYAFGLVWRPALCFFVGIVLIVFGVRGVTPPPAGGAAA